MRAEELSEEATECRQELDQYEHRIYVCMAAGCVSLQSEELLEELQDAVEERGLEDMVAVKGSGCMGLCAKGPLVQVQPAGLLYGEVSPRDADDIVDSLGEEPVDRLRVPQQQQFYGNQKRIVLENAGRVDPTSLEGKAMWAKLFQDLTAVIDSLGLCLFTSFELDADDYCDLYNTIVGEKRESDELVQTGERIWNLERDFNLRAGIGPDEDTLPSRLLQEPIPEGPAEGQVHRLEELLPEYYRERGWTEEGRPTGEKLAELGLQ